MKKTKLQKILGIGLTLTLVLSLGLVFAAAPVAAADDEWSAYAIPDAGADGDYFMDEGIDVVGPIARDIDGNFWAYVELNGGADEHIAKSLDTEGRTWALTEYFGDIGGVVAIDIVCSPLDADVAYAATGVSLYKTEDGGDSWDEIGNNALLTGTNTCLAVGWDEDDDARVFMGDNAGDVFYLYDVPFGSNWTDLVLDVAGGAPTSVLGISVSPNFDEDAFQAVLAMDADETWLAYHIGSDPGGWDDVELENDIVGNLTLTAGSDPVYPEDFNGDEFYDEDTEIFVGIDATVHTVGTTNLGGIYRIYGTTNDDYEILDDVDDDIATLTAVGTLGNMQFLAGAAGASDVWYSWDDGTNWEQASAEGINPAGGAVDTHVLMDADFDEDAGIGWAATSGLEGGMHTTIDGGTSWQGAGLLDTAIDQIIAAVVVTASPETVYLLCEDTVTTDEAELFRYDSGTEVWTRLYVEAQYGLGAPTLLAVLDDTIVMAAGAGTNVIFSSNAGQTFAQPDEEPTDAIISLLIIDEETWWIGDTDGDLWVTDDAGDRSWDEFQIDAASDITSLAVRGDEAIAGTGDSEVYYSEDAGETWDEVGSGGDFTTATTADVATYVCFDSGNNNTDVIYAASDDVSARFQYLTTDLTEAWEEFDDGVGAIQLDDATSIACSEGVVYVGNADDAEGVVRVVEPLADLGDVSASEVDELVDEGLAAGDIMLGGIFVTSASPNTVWGIETTAGGTVLWQYTDLMVGPLTGLMADPGDLEYTLTWDGFDNATDYEVQVYADEDFRAVYVEFDNDTGDADPLLIDAAGVTAGSTYWVQARASAPVHSKWSPVYTFSTSPGAVGIDEDTLAPQLGALNVPIDTPFSWGFDEDADSYLIEISDTADFSNIIDSATVTVPAYQSAVTLNECTNYWFRVYAIAGGHRGNPAYSSFTTACAGAVAPTPPAATPTPVEVIQQTITPNYIYAIIGIGAALAVLVIVLITKTRRT